MKKSKKLKVAKETIQNLESRVVKDVVGGCVSHRVEFTCDMNTACIY